MPLVKKLRKPCIRCERMFVADGKFTIICDKCKGIKQIHGTKGKIKCFDCKNNKRTRGSTLIKGKVYCGSCKYKHLKKLPARQPTFKKLQSISKL